MKKVVVVAYLFIVVFVLSGFNRQKVETHSLTVEVLGLRNSNGIVQFALYNDEDSFPDEHYKKYYRKQTAKIINGRSEVTFKNLPPENMPLMFCTMRMRTEKLKKALSSQKKD